MRLSAFLLILTLLSQTPLRLNASCGKRSVRKSSSRIVGGTESTPSKWPWMAAIFKRNSYICGGTIINSRYILSAAHCVVGGGPPAPASAYVLLLGAHDLRKNVGAAYQVSAVFVPGDYKVNVQYNDVTLFQTSVAITFNTQVAPICLPTGDMGKLAGHSATIAGWGATSEGSSMTPILREVTVPVIGIETCKSEFRKYRIGGLEQGIVDTQICAGKNSGGQDSCQGDSGGPLMMSMDEGSTWTLAGIVSFGIGCARPGFPGVYTRVDKYLTWIHKYSNGTITERKSQPKKKKG